MFDAIVLRLRVARVQAEIVAQLKDCGVRDQDFVNRICQTEESLRLIDTLFKISYYKKSQAAVFLYASTVLGRVRISTLRNENETFSQLNSITYIGVFLRLVTYSHLP
ncbi:hypothetical protein [Serratia nevei]|uniref:hypothetical protein n=1 Tax=Serratia nevei TaxID=2703794 RepID=UPI003F818BF9